MELKYLGRFDGVVSYNEALYSYVEIRFTNLEEKNTYYKTIARYDRNSSEGYESLVVCNNKSVLSYKQKRYNSSLYILEGAERETFFVVREYKIKSKEKEHLDELKKLYDETMEESKKYDLELEKLGNISKLIRSTVKSIQNPIIQDNLDRINNCLLDFELFGYDIGKIKFDKESFIIEKIGSWRKLS